MLAGTTKLFSSRHRGQLVRYIVKLVASKMSRVEVETTVPLLVGTREKNTATPSNSVREVAPLCTGRSVEEYDRCIEDLNLLQSNRRVLSKDASYMFELFRKQLALSGLNKADLNKLKVIHVTGTKGKGSTCAFVERIMRAANLKTGLYSSPHLVEVNERIKINGRPISNMKFSQYFRPIYNKLLDECARNDVPMPGYFAFLTILALDTFIKEQVDCVVLEVGIGGEYDSTNVIQNPVACGISTLDYDHTNILGNTIEEIAWTKSGIAKKGVPLFTVEQPDAPEATQVIRRRCSEQGSSMHICSPLPKHCIKLGIQGDAQYMNAALACQLSSYFLSKESPSITSLPHLDERMHTNFNQLPEFFSQALADCSLPGRCQMLRTGAKTYFIDGAHTRKSMENCLKWFVDQSSKSSQQVKRVLILNIIGERDKISILEPLVNYGQFDEVIFTSNRLRMIEDNVPKVMNCHAFGETIDSANLNFNAWTSLMNPSSTTKCSIIPSVSESIEYIDKVMAHEPAREAHVLVTGSLALAGAALKMLEDLNKV